MADSFLTAEAPGAGSALPLGRRSAPAGMSSVSGTAPAWSNPFPAQHKKNRPPNRGPVLPIEPHSERNLVAVGPTG
jgi:hypothetical protein